MNRILISFTFVSILSITNNGFSFSQQSPTYAAQAGNPQQYNQQYSQGNNNQNNNTPNWQTQFNNQYNNNNNNTPANNYNNNPANNNQNNAVNNNNRSNNPFLNNTIRRYEKFSAVVYRVNRRGKLYKKFLGYRTDSAGGFTTPDKYLKKAIVIFFGDWCPNCAKFLSSISKYLKQLIDSGIKIVFVSVPSIDRIQNWQKPSIADYNEAMSKLRSFNIDLAQLDPNGYDSSGNPNKRKNKKVELLLLGDNYSLSNNDIDSLPVMIAIKNSIEQFRGGSDNSLDVVNFENPTSMQQFQEIWREEERDDDDDDDEYDDDDDEYDEQSEEYPEHRDEYDDEDDDTDYDDNVVKHKKTCNCSKKCTCNKKKKKQVKKKPKQVKCTCTDSAPKKTKVVSVKRKPGNNKPSKRSTLDKQLDNFYTDMLNKGCDCILSNVNPQPPQIIYQKPVKVIKQPAPVVIQNATVDANFIEDPAPKKKINWNCVKTQPPRPRCKSKVRQKWRNKIDRAVEKRTERSLAAQREGCDCSRRRN